MVGNRCCLDKFYAGIYFIKIVLTFFSLVEVTKYHLYYINGKLSVKATNKKGTLDGVYFSYNADGSVFFEGLYEDGIRAGEWKYYNESGDLDTIIHE